MTQQIIVYIIGAVVFSLVGYKIYIALSGRATKDPCSGCSGCDLKRELDAKRRDGCKEKHSNGFEEKHSNKTCCGK